MARSSFNAIASWNQLHLRTDNFGPLESGGNVTSWPDANGGTASAPIGTAPAYAADALGNGTGPGIVLSNGVNEGMNSILSLGGDFTLFIALRVQDLSSASFVWLGDDNDEASVYHEGFGTPTGDLYLFAPGVSNTQTVSNNTIYRAIWTRSGTTNNLYIDGVMTDTANGNPTIGVEWAGAAANPSFSFGGTVLCYGGLVGTALSGADITATDAAMLEELDGIGDGGASEFAALQLGANF